MSEPLDPAAIMAEHYRHPLDGETSPCRCCGEPYPCEKRQMAAELAGHSWQFYGRGDNAYIMCATCGRLQDAFTGQTIRSAR